MVHLLSDPFRNICCQKAVTAAVNIREILSVCLSTDQNQRKVVQALLGLGLCVGTAIWIIRRGNSQKELVEISLKEWVAGCSKLRGLIKQGKINECKKWIKDIKLPERLGRVECALIDFKTELFSKVFNRESVERTLTELQELLALMTDWEVVDDQTSVRS